jgi:hypothetical protein
MSNEAHHLEFPRTLDLETGDHEPWSLQLVAEKPSLPNTPSTQTLALRSPPSSIFPTKEFKVEVESTPRPKPDPKPSKKKVSRWILWRLWFNMYRYESFSIW